MLSAVHFYLQPCIKSKGFFGILTNPLMNELLFNPRTIYSLQIHQREWRVLSVMLITNRRLFRGGEEEEKVLT